MLKRIAMLLAALFVVLTALSFAQGEAGEAQFTLLVYISGSNLESQAAAATRDIIEMLDAGVNEERVNLLFMTGGSQMWWSGLPSDQVCICQSAGTQLNLLEQIGAVSMGEASTLERFLDYGYENFPAQQYALILWDHGGGPLEGVCYDDLFDSDNLSLKELGAALEASPFGAENPLEWIGFDACLMSSVETAYICAPFAKYMIASQEIEPGTGWDYRFLQCLEEGNNGAEIGRQIVDAYFENANEQQADSLTLACIDLAKIDGIEDAMNRLFDKLDGFVDPARFSQLSNLRRDANSLGRSTTGSDYDLADLHHLAQQYAQLAPEEAGELITAVEQAVTYQRGDAENRCGLSVYCPYYNKDYYKSKWGETYAELGFSKSYASYLSDYADVWLGEALADWTGMQPACGLSQEGAPEVTLELTDEQAEHFASAGLYILDTFGGDDAYYDIFHVDDVVLDENTLRASYDYEALYVLDADGNPLTSALPYTTYGNSYFIRAELSNINRNEDFMGWLQGLRIMVYLQCKRVPNSDELQVVNTILIPGGDAFHYPSDEGMLFSGKQVITLSPDNWAWIQFMRYPRIRIDGEGGELTAFPEWPYSSEVDGSFKQDYFCLNNAEPWTLKFCKEQFGGRTLHAQYVIRDTQGELAASKLTPIVNPNLVDTVQEEKVLVDDPDLRVTLMSIEVADSERNAGLYLRMRFENDTGYKLYAQLDGTALDGTAVERQYMLGGRWSEGGAEGFNFVIPADDLPPLTDSTVRELAFNLRVTLDLDSQIERCYPIHIAQEVNIGNLQKPLPEMNAPLAETSVEGVRFQLLRLQELESGALSAVLHIVNEGEEAYDTYMNGDSIINDCFFVDNCDGKHFIILPGCDGFMTVELDCYTARESSEREGCRFEAENGFDYWGINAVDSLVLDNAAIRLELNVPFQLSQTREAPLEHALLSAEGFSVSLRGAQIVDDVLRLDVSLRNDKDREIELHVDKALIDGVSSDAKMQVDAWLDVNDRVFISAKLSRRAVIEIPLKGNHAPEQLELGFQYYDYSDGSEHSSAPVRIVPVQGGAEELNVQQMS